MKKVAFELGIIYLILLPKYLPISIKLQSFHNPHAIMKIKKEMHSPESTSTPGSGGKAKYSENIVLQDLEEDIEKTLSLV